MRKLTESEKEGIALAIVCSLITGLIVMWLCGH
jgi:hypothetical protein